MPKRPFPTFRKGYPADGIFNPSSISNCICWYDASNTNSLTLDVNNKVSSWHDTIGDVYATQATESKRPVWYSTGINGYPALLFSSSAEQWLSSGNNYNWSGTDNERSWFAIFQRSANSQMTVYAKSYYGPTNYRFSLLYTSGSETSLIDLGNVNSEIGYSESGTNAKTTIIRASKTIPIHQIFSDGVYKAQTTNGLYNASANSTNRFLIGAYNNSSDNGEQIGYFMNGYISEIAMWDHYLNIGEIGSLTAYANTKYGI